MCRQVLVYLFLCGYQKYVTSTDTGLLQLRFRNPCQNIRNPLIFCKKWLLTHIVYTAFGLDKLLFLCFNHHYKLWKEEVNQRFTYRDWPVGERRKKESGWIHPGVSHWKRCLVGCDGRLPLESQGIDCCTRLRQIYSVN